MPGVELDRFARLLRDGGFFIRISLTDRKKQMDNTYLLITAMAQLCRSLIQEWNEPAPDLPKPLQLKHLLWMCDQIEKHAEDGPATKLHRWIGFVQAAMLANRMIDLDGLKTMFDEAKRAHGETSEDLEDLLDHLDPTSFFEFEIGGQG
jgi:hypothetical protein